MILWVSAMGIAIVALVFAVVSVLQSSPVGPRSLRIRAGASADNSEDPSLADRVLQLEGEVEDLTRAIELLQEDAEFTQRLLENVPASGEPRSIQHPDR